MRFTNVLLLYETLFESRSLMQIKYSGKRENIHKYLGKVFILLYKSSQLKMCNILEMNKNNAIITIKSNH